MIFDFLERGGNFFWWEGLEWGGGGVESWGMSIRMLRCVSLLEGLSYLWLLYCSIYEKRILGKEDAIAVPGMVHGVLFILFCMALFHVWMDRGWGWKKVGFAFVCSLLPFAPFYLERKLKKDEGGRKI